MTTKLKPELIKELRIILKEEFGKDLENSEVEKIGLSLVGYFDLLLMGDKRFGNHQPSLIDRAN